MGSLSLNHPPGRPPHQGGSPAVKERLEKLHLPSTVVLSTSCTRRGWRRRFARWWNSESRWHRRMFSSKIVFLQSSSFVKDCLPSKVVFCQRSFSVKGCYPSKVIFRQRSSSVKGRLLSAIVIRQRSSSIKGRLPSKVFFHGKLSSLLGHYLWVLVLSVA